jgi:GTP-binding protein HflX
LEYDRRVIRERIATINRKLEEEKAGRAVRGARLREEGPPTVALVGYTNAGKTTILNALSGARRSTEDRLFETLATTTRLVEGSRKYGPDGMWPDFVVTDTVGFIRKLPTQLVHSFASTLEVARDCDVTVVCADASSEELEEEIQTVTRTLSGAVEDGVGTGPMVMCLNKMDLVSDSRAAELRRDHPHAVIISATLDCEALVEEIYRAIASRRERMRVFIPHAEYAAASRLYGLAEIYAQENTEAGLWMDVSLPRSASGKYAPYRV